MPNKKFYEVQAIPLNGAASAAVSDDLPTLPVSRSKIELKGFVPGSLVGSLVLAVGAKGVGSWCDPITARV